ncbi:MAG: beta-lactamase family protein [Bacillus sp. (in: Bacteria)]|nr:beta-lactamase family protein [Bacillus sp. (in: firmicutes)]
MDHNFRKGVRELQREKIIASIEESFRKKVKNDPKLNNAYLMVHGEKADIHLNIAEGKTGEFTAHPNQPNYMASVGKLFTSTLISILFEKGDLSFDDTISKHLDGELLNNLHVYNGKDYTNDIKIDHLLKQTSGLDDHFWPMLDKLIKNPNLTMTPREAIVWGKNNLEPKFPPGEKLHYTDTNYHLLGLIIENITGMTFHDALKQFIFEPFEMNHSFVLHSSKPIEESPYPVADFYFNGIRMNGVKGYAGIDYAGGGVVAPSEDLLKFMKALVSHQIISKKTLDLMMKEPVKFGLGIDYGYGIWIIKTVPLLMPKKFNSWGVTGVTGAFMFYHQELDAYLIGNFNDDSYKTKGVRFMLLDVINKLSKLKV